MPEEGFSKKGADFIARITQKGRMIHDEDISLRALRVQGKKKKKG